MDTDAELKARIAALTGKINNAKQNNLSHEPTAFHRGLIPINQAQPYRGKQQYSPYARGVRGGRGSRGGHFGVHKNRTLVLNNTQTTSDEQVSDSMKDAPSSELKLSPSLVSTRRAGTNQLMTKNTFEREQKQQQEYQAVPTNVVTSKRPTSSSSAKRGNEKHDLPMTQKTRRELQIDGILFQVLDDGSKFIRITDTENEAKQTPKRIRVANVDFFRTKHGNLVRASTDQKSGRPIKRVQKPQCENFTKHGKCPFGPACKFTHDPTKTAICKEYLRSGSCPAGKNCDLSHEPTYHRVSACAHFLRGNCTNDACRYPHVHVSSAAPVCRPFATLGYCPKGSDCDKRHVFECPDYSNHGHCVGREQGTCSLPHVDRASTLRKAAQRLAKTGNENESDLSSEEDEKQSEHDSDEIDSDEIDSDIDVLMGSDENSRELSQQNDFVPFG